MNDFGQFETLCIWHENYPIEIWSKGFRRIPVEKWSEYGGVMSTVERKSAKKLKKVGKKSAERFVRKKKTFKKTKQNYVLKKV